MPKYHYRFYFQNDILDDEDCFSYYETKDKETADIVAESEALLFDEQGDSFTVPEFDEEGGEEYSEKDANFILLEGIKVAKSKIEMLKSFAKKAQQSLDKE